ncbi:hypothetical protein [Bacillus sp. PK30]|uniref:hypothetical protein n=1 Tax=Bacillus sp. PK30 TaxID=2954724 RepID=UPI0030F9F9A7
MEMQDLLNLLHETAKQFLVMFAGTYGVKQAERISDRANKRTVPNAGKRKNGSTQKK